MFRRKQVIQNELVARCMKKFFKTFHGGRQSESPKPELVARAYGALMLNRRTSILVDAKAQSRSRFYIGLSICGNSLTFEQVTKRAALISDTLLLSHDWTEKRHHLGAWNVGCAPDPLPSGKHGIMPMEAYSPFDDDSGHVFNRTYGMHCPSLFALGRWILDAEPLLKAGLAWYLPSYSSIRNRQQHILARPERVRVIDYLATDGRAVDASGAEPIKSQLVRPVLRIELPFIDGVNLRDFSEITIEEFASYSAFRDFLRQSFLDMDESLNSAQSDRELLKIGLQIKDQIRSARSKMENTRRKRAVAASGAAIGSMGAILVAVYGPALATAVAAIGASGGIWGFIHAAAENNTRALRGDKWHYVWVLANRNNTHVI